MIKIKDLMVMKGLVLSPKNFINPQELQTHSPSTQWFVCLRLIGPLRLKTHDKEDDEKKNQLQYIPSEIELEIEEKKAYEDYSIPSVNNKIDKNLPDSLMTTLRITELKR